VLIYSFLDTETSNKNSLIRQSGTIKTIYIDGIVVDYTQNKSLFPIISKYLTSNPKNKKLSDETITSFGSLDIETFQYDKNNIRPYA